MNKCKRAKEWIDSLDDDWSRVDIEWEAVDEIRKLVDKATPKKPPKHDKVVCPTCNSKANYGHPYTEYCCHCGQALDWSKDE